MQVSALIYDLLIRGYVAAITAASPFSAKAKQWKEGRKGWQEQWKNALDIANPQRKNHVVWMHVASLGEYEQGLPVLEEIKKRWPQVCTVVSFFSPSGMEHANPSAAVDVKQYLPADTRSNAQRLTEILKPNLVLWVKYEYWFHYIHSIHNTNTPLFLLSGTFQKHQPFFKWYGSLHRAMLARFDKLFVQRDSDAQLVKQFVPAKKVVVCGDTRFDKVRANAAQPVQFPIITNWAAKFKSVLVAGSTWPGDEKLLAVAADAMQYLAFVIVPHNIGEQDIKETAALFSNALRYSQLETTGNSISVSNVLIVDRVGMLKHLYAVGDIAFIGGGFTKDGVHNVPEAAAFGKPILHGPNYSKYREATELVELGATVVVENAEALQQQIQVLQSANENARRGSLAKKFIENGSGATRVIADYIQEKRLLTSE